MQISKLPVGSQLRKQSKRGGVGSAGQKLKIKGSIWYDLPKIRG